jgi:ABC-type Fe3+ transport system permease subunit
MFSRPSGVLLLNLAIANILLCLLHMPMPIIIGTSGIGNFYVACQAAGFLLVMLTAVIISTVALMSLDRVIYLKKPLTYDRIVKPRRILPVIISVWILGLALSLPPLLGFGEVGYADNILACTTLTHENMRLVNSYVQYYILVAVLAASGHLIQLFGCGCIIYITRKHLLKRLRRAVGSVKGKGRKQTTEMKVGKNEAFKKYTKDQLTMVKVFGAIFTASLLTLLPVIAYLVSVFFSNYKVTLWLATAAYLSVLSKSVVHPIVESYMTYEIRQTISKLLPSCTNRCFTGKSDAESTRNTSKQN